MMKTIIKPFHSLPLLFLLMSTFFYGQGKPSDITQHTPDSLYIQFEKMPTNNADNLVLVFIVNYKEGRRDIFGDLYYPGETNQKNYLTNIKLNSPIPISSFAGYTWNELATQVSDIRILLLLANPKNSNVLSKTKNELSFRKKTYSSHEVVSQLDQRFIIEEWTITADDLNKGNRLLIFR
jgi:hypothetical protein